MKKSAFIIALVLGMSFSLVGCSQEGKSTNEPAKSTVVTKEKENDSKEKESKTEKEEPETYVSSKLGFEIDFPKSWHGYYIVDESYDNLLRVSFIGKSKTSEGFSEDSAKKDGLLMFFIGSEVDREFSDSVKHIGTVDGVDYYYGTSTDYPIGALLVSPESKPEDIGVDEEEMKLMEEDFKKAKDMEKDIEDILKTFRKND